MSILDRLREMLAGSADDSSEHEHEMGPSALIVGLGNPGLEYSATRHNLGFLCLERLAEKHRLRFTGKRGKSLVARGALNGHDVALAKPQTFMNLSCEAVRELARIYGVPPKSILVIYDDVDLPVGTIRLRANGGPGTHNGMRSIVDELGRTDFPRLRIGVGVPANGQNLADYVLGHPSPEERTILDESLGRAVEATETVIRRGVGAA